VQPEISRATTGLAPLGREITHVSRKAIVVAVVDRLSNARLARERRVPNAEEPSALSKTGKSIAPSLCTIGYYEHKIICQLSSPSALLEARARKLGNTWLAARQQKTGSSEPAFVAKLGCPSKDFL
jgi:hypothetical protein